MYARAIVGLGLFLVFACSSGDAAGPPPCGSERRGLTTLIPGPDRPGHDAALAAKARRHDRMYAAVNSRATGLNTEVSLTDTSSAGKEPFERFLATDSWDFESVVGTKPESLVIWAKSAGLYSGIGVSADAYRYGALRDAGEDCAEIEQARSQLVRGLRGMDIASRITGGKGVIARSLHNLELPHDPFPHALTPLFDADGSPLPPEKNNGQWRHDNSGQLPSWAWEDSLSRDMLVGWAMAYGVVFEVLEADDSIPAELMARLRENARLTAHALMKIGDHGYDLEIPDADGRLTFHAYLNENVVDRLYLPGANNGFHAIMALGIVAAFAHAAGDAQIDAWRDHELVEKRNLPKIADDDMLVVSLGVGANFSNYNMAFTGMFLAQRYLTHERADGFLLHALEHELYLKDELTERSPVELSQSFFDFIYAAGIAGARFDRAGHAPPPGALTRGLQTLAEFPDAPLFDRARNHCDAAELAARRCVLDDGTEVEIERELGWAERVVATQPLPMRLRPPSNYYWRTNPYEVGGGGTERLFSAVDFRIAYWMGRWIRVD